MVAARSCPVLPGPAPPGRDHFEVHALKLKYTHPGAAHPFSHNLCRQYL